MLGGDIPFAAHFLPDIEVGFELLHHGAELGEVKGLRAVAHGLFRAGMHFHNQAVRADGDGRAA